MNEREDISEAQLCAEFRTWVEQDGWTVYPEVSDWDMVLTPPALRGANAFSKVMPSTYAETQYGIHAKLVAGVDVIYQAIQKGPKWRLVLVRRAGPEFIEICMRLNIGVVVREQNRGRWGRKARWERPSTGFAVWMPNRGFEPWGDLWLPPIAADLPAGCASPSPLTKWRVGALKLCKVARTQGFITSADFKAAKVNIQRWVQMGWLEDTGEMAGRLKKYRLGNTPPDIGWEKVSEQLHDALDKKEQNG